MCCHWQFTTQGPANPAILREGGEGIHLSIAGLERSGQPSNDRSSRTICAAAKGCSLSLTLAISLRAALKTSAGATCLSPGGAGEARACVALLIWPWRATNASHKGDALLAGTLRLNRKQAHAYPDACRRLLGKVVCGGH